MRIIIIITVIPTSSSRSYPHIIMVIPTSSSRSYPHIIPIIMVMVHPPVQLSVRYGGVGCWWKSSLLDQVRKNTGMSCKSAMFMMIRCAKSMSSSCAQAVDLPALHPSHWTQQHSVVPQ